MAMANKELRFTRARQAVPIWLFAAMCLIAAVTLGACAWFGSVPVWLVPLPLLPAALAIRLAVHMVRHAYIILSPVGIEIFPVFRAEKRMIVVMWQEIERIEAEEGSNWLRIEYPGENAGGVVLSLSPIPLKLRPLLLKAVRGRIATLSDQPSTTNIS